MRVIILGRGYVGAALASQLRQKPDCEVWTLSRNPRQPTPYTLSGDITNPDRFDLPPNLTHAVFCAGLKGAEESEYQALFVDGLGHVLQKLGEHPIERFVFTSTTGVYAEAEGNWVDEDSPVQARRTSTAYYIAAEKTLGRTAFPSVIARLSGIYGPERTKMIDAALRDPIGRRARWARPAGPSVPGYRMHALLNHLSQEDSNSHDRGPDSPQYVNHIHQHDAAAALAHLLTVESPAAIYNVTDTLPVERQTLLDWIASHCTFSAPSPPAPATPRNRGGSKRVRVHRLLESGFRHQYPTYRDGYVDLIRIKNLC